MRLIVIKFTLDLDAADLPFPLPPVLYYPYPKTGATRCAEQMLQWHLDIARMDFGAADLDSEKVVCHTSNALCNASPIPSLPFPSLPFPTPEWGIG